jgi:cell division protein FtsA
MHEQGHYIVGLDVGTYQVRAVVGYLDPSSPVPNIVGVGKSVNGGMRKGSVVNINAVAKAIDQALEEAERMSGHQITDVTVNVNGAHINGMSSKGVIAVGAQGHEINEEDITRVEEAATIVQLPANREILQVTPRSYKLDGNDNVRDPLGMKGVRLEVDAYVITVLAPEINNLEKSVTNTDTRVRRITLSSLAASRAVLPANLVENGVVLIDIGGMTTNLAVFEEGDLQHIAVIPMGSNHITNDLAIGLKTDLEIAEQIKVRHAVAEAREGKDALKDIKVERGGEKLKFSTEAIDMIVEARLDEMFELIDKELGRIKRSGKLPGGAVLVGGGAKLRGMDGVAKEKLRMSARLGKLDSYQSVSNEVHNLEFATTIGLMMLDIDMQSGRVPHVDKLNKSGIGTKKLTSSLSSLFKKLKP